jgi:LuxR family maltose regulon positive regulatory protein
METHLLQTKLYIPAPRPELVSRPRLIERLNAALVLDDKYRGLHRKLTLVSAPAGFGKTTLVSEWIAQIPNPKSQIGNRVAWLSLDESDNDLTRFLVYFIAALQTLALPALSPVEGSQVEGPVLSGVEGIEANIGQGALSGLQIPSAADDRGDPDRPLGNDKTCTRRKQ